MAYNGAMAPWSTRSWPTLALILLPACVFDSQGLPSSRVDAWADRGRDLVAVDQPRDLGAGADLDAQADAGPDAPPPDQAVVDATGADADAAPDSTTTDTTPTDGNPTKPDKQLPTCKALFGKVKGYHLCEEKADRCKFFREEAKKKTCDEMCGKHTCLGANNADSKHKCKADTTNCSSKSSDSNCICSKL